MDDVTPDDLPSEYEGLGDRDQFRMYNNIIESEVIGHYCWVLPEEPGFNQTYHSIVVSRAEFGHGVGYIVRDGIGSEYDTDSETITTNVEGFCNCDDVTEHFPDHTRIAGDEIPADIQAIIDSCDYIIRQF